MKKRKYDKKDMQKLILKLKLKLDSSDDNSQSEPQQSVVENEANSSEENKQI
jgi:hypothetical protein